MKIFFYVPSEKMPANEDIKQPVKSHLFSVGIYCWTIQTWQKLNEFGYQCELASELPKAGIIVSHIGLLEKDFKPSASQILVCIQADWGRHPYAHYHICQNKVQTRKSGIPRLQRYFCPGKTYFVHHWPQPNLKARTNEVSGLKTIGYFGLSKNLAKELQSQDWESFLNKLNIRWKIKSSSEEWCDYTEIDAVICARDFSGKKHGHKPATKLYNAWIAGVAPICTNESAYVEEIAANRKSAILIHNYEDLKQAVKTLKEHKELIGEIVANGQTLKENYSDEAISKEWFNILTDIKQHRKSLLRHSLFITFRFLSLFLVKNFRNRIIKYY